uniref:Exonuclease domain-containing protein n=1 Tax=Kalanchoe fedtschenkoi TaxID=63787 RepID=A0A7N0VF54_KALFE
MTNPIDDRSEIVFFDVETTVPTRPGQGYALLEFGAILVCPRKLAELESYATLIRPEDLSKINSLSVRCNGISRDSVVSAPSFRDVADRVYDLLHGRVWAGHNILRFDCLRIKEAFEEVGRAAPEPKGTIDSLAILTQKFGRRAGNMKMASLAAYFGLGEQTHRSLDDVRMNFEVVKHCATVLFLESSLPDIFPANSWVSPPSATTRSRSNGKVTSSTTTSSSSLNLKNNPIPIDLEEKRDESHQCPSPSLWSREKQVLNQAESSAFQRSAFDMGALKNEMKTENFQPDVNMEENNVTGSSEMLRQSSVFEGCSDGSGFVDPDEVSIPSISVALCPFSWGTQRLRILHKNAVLQICCPRLRVRFGINTKFSDHAGRPRFSFVVDASASLCRVLDACDDAALKLSVDSGSDSEWRPAVMRKNGYFNSPNVRLHLPAAVNGENATSGAEIYHQDSSGATQKLTFNASNAGEHELGTLLIPGTAVDAYISLEPYDFKQNTGIKLVVKKLVIHSA